MVKCMISMQFLPHTRACRYPVLFIVTNLDNGRTLVVRVNDRGPFVGDRLLDLSYGAAARLGIVEDGVVRVKIELINAASPLLRSSRN